MKQLQSVQSHRGFTIKPGSRIQFKAAGKYARACGVSGRRFKSTVTEISHDPDNGIWLRVKRVYGDVDGHLVPLTNAFEVK